MDSVGLDIQTGAKALVPNKFRPIGDKASWGQPLLTGRQFLGLLSVTIACSVSGLLLYYSFYVAFILSSAETFSPPAKSRNTPEPRVAGSYRKIMRHIFSSYGWRYFVGGAGTFVWTTLLAFVGRQALSRVLPETSKSDSIFSLLGGSDTVSSFVLEPLGIIFTHRVLTPVNFSSFATLKRPSRLDFYITLVYIGSVRVVTSATQSSLMVTDTTQHYARPFATFTAYLALLIIRTVLITRAHASLLPPTVATTVDIRGTTELEVGPRLWQWCLRTLKMFRLLFVCILLAVLHTVMTLAGILYASGQSQKVISWAYSATQTAQEKPTRDPGLMMAYDPELDPHHFH